MNDLVRQQQAQAMGMQSQNQVQFGAASPINLASLVQSQYTNSSLTPQEPKKRGFMKALKEYIATHKDLLFTIALVLVIDRYVFNGVFREKIKGAVDKLLDKAHKQIGD